MIDENLQAVVKRVILLTKNARAISSKVHAKIPTKNGVFTWADLPPYSPDSEDADIRALYAANQELKAYLCGLSLETVKGVIALMYLGRNGAVDGMECIPIAMRFPMYLRDYYCRKDKVNMARHIASKSGLLDEFLEDGLRFVGLEVTGNGR